MYQSISPSTGVASSASSSSPSSMTGFAFSLPENGSSSSTGPSSSSSSTSSVDSSEAVLSWESSSLLRCRSAVSCCSGAADSRSPPAVSSVAVGSVSEKFSFSCIAIHEVVLRMFESCQLIPSLGGLEGRTTRKDRTRLKFQRV